MSMSQHDSLKSVLSKVALSGLLAVLSPACGGDVGEPLPEAEPLGSTAPLSFEEFLSGVYQEPWEGGLFLYNGDTTARSMEELREAWSRMGIAQQGLAVNRVNGADAVWSSTQKLNLRYCVSNGFGGNKSEVVSAMATAAAAWEQYASVDFIYASDQDGACTSSNTSVTFDVKPVNVDGQYLARAFFPNYGRSSRNILIDSTAFSSSWTMEAILKHELGHALGFRHEHTRPEAGKCFEDSDWRGVTPYDRASIMHYPQCGGTNSQLSYLSTSDVEGAVFIYGSKSWSSPVQPSGNCGTLSAGQGLGINQSLWSCDGRFELKHQDDGNLALYKGGTALWGAGTQGKAGYGTYLQGDGNLVIYTGRGRALWDSDTHGHSGAHLLVQNDGNVVIYHNGRAIWSTGTAGH